MRAFWAIVLMVLLYVGPYIVNQPWYDSHGWYVFPTVMTWFVALAAGTIKFFDARIAHNGGR